MGPVNMLTAGEVDILAFTANGGIDDEPALAANVLTPGTPLRLDWKVVNATQLRVQRIGTHGPPVNVTDPNQTSADLGRRARRAVAVHIPLDGAGTVRRSPDEDSRQCSLTTQLTTVAGQKHASVTERARYSYAWRSFLDHGVALAFGTDWPVAPLDPILGVYAAVTRATLDEKNPGGWIPEEKITLSEAIEAYTVGAAFAEFQEREKGSISTGKLADMVILSDNIFELKPEAIRNAKVKTTILGGKVVYGEP